MVQSVNLTGQNWLITAAGNLPATRPQNDQLWLLVLSGTGTVSVKGNGSTVQWVSDTLRIVPDLQAPLVSVYNEVVFAGTWLAFNLVNWAPFVAISGVTSTSNFNIDDGFLLDVWRPTPFVPGLIDADGQSVPQVFQGVDADVSVLNTSEITAVSYNFTLLGSIVLLGHPENA